MKTKVVLVAAVASIFSACGSTSSNNDAGVDAGNPNAFPQPAGTVAVNFTIDDTANKVFKVGELEWKGSQKYDAATRKVTLDSTWGGPYPKMFDDGPWSAGGHEPAGSTAGDHKWGITVFATPPAAAMDTYEYGAIDSTLSDGWIWRGDNGKYVVAAGATAPVNAASLVLPPFGTTDIKFVIDTNALDTTSSWNASKVGIKGSAWFWTPVELKDDGTKGDDVANDKKFTFVLSAYTGSTGQFPHAGLGNSGDAPEFNFLLNDVEYKDASKIALTTGVTAFVKPAGGSFTAATIGINNKNTKITVP
jgi:hypothetical protein